MEWVAADGKKHKITYAVPNQNQCKGCHSYDGLFVPIGVTARQVNRVEGEKNELTTWANRGDFWFPRILPWKARLCFLIIEP